MKKGGDCFVAALRLYKPGSCYSSENWRRHLSSLRTAAENYQCPSSTRKQGELWDTFPVIGSQWWDNTSNQGNSKLPESVYATMGVTLWLDSQDERMLLPGNAVGKFSKPKFACGAQRKDTGSDLQFQTLSKRCEEGELVEAVQTLHLLVELGCDVQDFLFYRVLKRCMKQKDLVLGRRVHGLALKSGHELNSFLANHIIRMYSSHGMLQEATEAFTKVAAPNNHVWAGIILAHAERGQPTEAINLYRQMCQSSVKPDNYIFVAVLKACATAEDLRSGKEVHANIIGSAVEPNVFVGSCLVDMYSKCGSLQDARTVFDSLPAKDVVTWTAMIAGYAQKGMAKEALALYGNMQDEGISPTHCTFLCLLRACASVGALSEGRELHAHIVRRGLEANVVVANSLVDMYAKCGSLEEARRVFDRLPERDVVTWTAMIAGYVHQDLSQKALALYTRMRQEDITPANHVTYVCLLQACSRVGALHQGKQLHAQIQERGLEADELIGSSLVGMYAKCGSLDDAHGVFDRLPKTHASTWNALINGYAENNHGQMALQCFEKMCQQGVQPNETTFSCLLVACSHARLVDEGKHCFKMMEDHGIVPTDYHYSSMVDLLGRSGRLDEAETMLQTMPFENDIIGWRSLLCACKSYGDVDRGERCFDHIISLEPKSAAPYVLLGNIYANAGRWRDVDRIESLRKFAGATKKPAKACIEVKSEVHEFIVGQNRNDISSRLRSVNWRLKEGGHVPHTELVLKLASEQEKQDALCGHAEKLALAYGLLNTPDGSPLLVTKNLRMCNDCHSSTKIMSRLEKREIIVRDAHCVHHFLDGSCSCGDWH